MPPRASRGEVWSVDLDPVQGHEQGRTRPAALLSAVIVSHDTFNNGPAELVVVVPMTTRHRPELDTLRVEVRPPDAGLAAVSYAMPEQVRAIATSRLRQRYGRLSPKKLAEIEDRVRVILNL